MSNISTFRAQSAPRNLVIALHCSGAGAGQWRGLREMLGTDYELIAPEHYGCESTGPWTGEHAFMTEAVDHIDAEQRHLAIRDETREPRCC